MENELVSLLETGSKVALPLLLLRALFFLAGWYQTLWSQYIEAVNHTQEVLVSLLKDREISSEQLEELLTKLRDSQNIK